MDPASSTAPPRGSLDLPAPGSIVGGELVEVRGWAADANGSVAVDLDVDGTPVAHARLGFPRPDVAAALGTPAAGLSGWECLLDLQSLAGGRPEVSIAAFARDGAGGRFEVGRSVVQVAAGGAREPTPRLGDPPPLQPQPARAPRAHGPLRILAVIHNLGRGGSQLILRERLGELVAAGEAEAVLASPSDGPLRASFEAIGVRCHLTGELTPPDEAQYEARLAELLAWSRPQGFDLVLANTIASSAGVDLAERLGLPCVWLLYEAPATERHLAAHVSLRWPAYAQAQARRALASCPAMVFDSDHVRERYRGWTPAERLVTVPGAIDLASIARFRAAFDRREGRRARGIPDEAELVLGLGTLFVHKGAPLLVQAFATLAAERPQAMLALVGALPDELATAVERFVTESGLGERVRIEPMGDEAYAWLAMADLMICSSDSESMPRVVLEAMAFEVPVLSTTVGDVPALIVDGESGWLIPHSDPAAMRLGLRRAFAASPEERRTMAAAATRRVAARDAPQAAARFSTVLRAALEDRPLPVC